MFKAHNLIFGTKDYELSFCSDIGRPYVTCFYWKTVLSFIGPTLGRRYFAVGVGLFWSHTAAGSDLVG
jgi:hypothetical protein